MGRRKSAYPDMPPRLLPRPRAQGGFLYYYQAQGKKIPLGSNLAIAKQEWARLETGGSNTSFLVVCDAYLAHCKPLVSTGTYEHYEIALRNLGKSFCKATLDQIQPKHVKDYIRKRSKKGAALFEKRVLSAMFNWARETGLTSSPNPCTGIKFSHAERKIYGKLGKRDIYVTDAQYADVHGRADPLLQDCMDLALLTGQRPSDVLKMTRQDIRDGELWIVQVKTGAKVGIRIEGELKRLLERILARPRRVQSMYLIATDKGQRLTYMAMNKRFVQARGKSTWQFRDIRAKAASDSPTLKAAQGLLGHATETTTTVYRRSKGIAVPPLK